jgi:purine-binding chemotaxis protein CheW
MQMSVDQYTTFQIDDHFFGVEVSKVQEVLLYQGMTRVPLAPSIIGGLINLRGQIVIAVDLRKRLAMKARENKSPPMNVVIYDNENAVSLLVDSIGDVIAVDTREAEVPPDNLPEVTKELISKVYKLKDRLLLILDTQKAINI